MFSAGKQQGSSMMTTNKIMTRMHSSFQKSLPVFVICVFDICILPFLLKNKTYGMKKKCIFISSLNLEHVNNTYDICVTCFFFLQKSGFIYWLSFLSVLIQVPLKGLYKHSN